MSRAAKSEITMRIRRMPLLRIPQVTTGQVYGSFSLLSYTAGSYRLGIFQVTTACDSQQVLPYQDSKNVPSETLLHCLQVCTTLLRVFFPVNTILY